MNQSQNPNLMENMSQKVINQIIENKNVTKHIKDSKPIKTTIQKKKKKKNHVTIQSTLISRTKKTQQTFSRSKAQQNHNSNPNTKTYLCYSIIA